jgi:hypothetical protein
MVPLAKGYTECTRLRSTYMPHTVLRIIRSGRLTDPRSAPYMQDMLCCVQCVSAPPAVSHVLYSHPASPATMRPRQNSSTLNRRSRPPTMRTPCMHGHINTQQTQGSQHVLSLDPSDNMSDMGAVQRHLCMSDMDAVQRHLYLKTNTAAHNVPEQPPTSNQHITFLKYCHHKS